MIEVPHWIKMYDDPTASATYGKRYVFADLDYREVAAEIRANLILTPTMSFQVYLQPFFSTGSYSSFRSLRKPKSFEFDSYGANGSILQPIVNAHGEIESYEIDSDGSGPSPTINVSNPNFSTVSFRGNAVFCWEYLPGSTLYIVWTHTRSEDDGSNVLKFRPMLQRLSRAEPWSIVMVKITYWFGV